METMIASLPPRAEMVRAMLDSDEQYDGIFYTAVRTTGIFCRPSCPARKPDPGNVEFYGRTREDGVVKEWVRCCLVLGSHSP